jgi:hypothetical protein
MLEIDLGLNWGETIPATIIIAICVFVGKIIKSFVKNPDVITKIPLILAGLGGVLNVLYFVFNVLITGDPMTLNPVSVFLTGLMAGWSSVGVHQTGKQLSEAKTCPYNKEIE